MAVTVYLSNTDIEVLIGSGSGKSVQVKKMYSAQLPEGCVLNGVITDAGSLVDTIGNMWKQCKLPANDVELVVNSPQIMVRVPDIPIQNVQKSVSYLRREYAEKNEDQLLGFYRLFNDSKKKTSKVCAEVADGDFINTYLQVFAEAGVKLSGIQSAVGAAINFFHKTDFAQGGNSVVLIRDGMTVTAILFVMGIYYYSSTNRLFNTPGTEEYANELAKIINQIDQFSRSQKIENPISAIYLAGMEAGDDALCKVAFEDVLSTAVNVRTLTSVKGVNTSGAGKNIDKIFYPTAALMPRQDDVNILKSIKKEKSEKEIKRETFIKRYVPYVLTALVMIIITVIVFVIHIKNSVYLAYLENYNTDTANRYAVMDYDKAANDVALLNQHYGGLKLMEKHINSYPAPVSRVIEVIEADAEGVGEVVVTGYDSTSGELEFTTSFTNVMSLNEFITRLKGEDIFTNVDYKGYTENVGQDSWTAILSCALAEEAGRDQVPVIVTYPDEEESEEVSE